MVFVENGTCSYHATYSISDFNQNVFEEPGKGMFVEPLSEGIEKHIHP